MPTSLLDADLSRATLERSNLSLADLRGADLDRSDLAGANFFQADFRVVDFEPIGDPNLRGIAGARNLELLTYETYPDAMTHLRQQLRDGGYIEQDRELTYALRHRWTQLRWEGCWPWAQPLAYGPLRRPEARQLLKDYQVLPLAGNCVSYAVNKLLFDRTCAYGKSPSRLLFLLFCTWLVSAAVYFKILRSGHGDSGLYLRTRDLRKGSEVIEEKRIEHRRAFYALSFSLMSAFNIGFRDVDFGRWLRLLTREEYEIKAKGLARTVAGLQSLTSLYLLALWILTYFGHPFE